MKIFRKKLVRQENIGVIDRSARLLGGFLLLLPLIFATTNVSDLLMNNLTYAIIILSYLMLTGMMGWDPVYMLFNGKTCGTSEKHPCGSYPYQLRALFGRRAEKDPGYRTRALKPGEHTEGSGSAGNWL